MTEPQPIRFHVAHTPARAATYVLEALDVNENVNGTFTHRAADLLESSYGVARVLVTHSATAALEMSAMVLASVHGAQRVFMPSYTFSSTANAFIRAGYDVEFIDVDPATMSPGLAEFAATNAPPNSVVVPVHYGGNPGEVDAIAAWAADRGVWVVEDAAQSLGAKIGGRDAGTFGSLGAVSFHFTKNIHSSMGGALFINELDFVDTATYIWERGTNRQAMLRGLVDKYSWVEVGSSFQTTELQAALLLAGLEEYDEVMAHREELWRRYAARLAGHDDAGLFTQQWRSEAKGNSHAFYVRTATPETAEDLRVTLKRAAIDAYIGYVPLHSSPYGETHGYSRSLPQTERWAECVLRLPLHTGMTPDDADRVGDVIVAWLTA
jgi:dTDP-4-amino-4,6-dideoxygalactose transaminase